MIGLQILKILSQHLKCQHKGQNMKNNYFPTLSEALDAENLSHAWPCTPIAYGQTIGLTYDDGSKYGYYISIYRDERGLYERPIHYKRG